MSGFVQASLRLSIALFAAMLLGACGGESNITASDANPVDVSSSRVTYTLGGTLSGLNAGAQLVLQSGAGDLLTLTANGNFTFATPYASGKSYSVLVHTLPVGQACSANGVKSCIDTFSDV